MQLCWHSERLSPVRVRSKQKKRIGLAPSARRLAEYPRTLLNFVVFVHGLHLPPSPTAPPLPDAQRSSQLVEEQPRGGPRRAVGHGREQRVQRGGGGAVARRRGGRLAFRRGRHRVFCSRHP